MSSFVLALLLLAAYPYVVYPALLHLLTARREDPAPPAPDDLPAVTVVVTAYNEEQVIAARIRNLASSAYPADRLTILIGSDGSSDDTVAAARSAARDVKARVEIVDFAARRGKTSVLDDLIRRAGTDILVLSDANSHFEEDAIARLVRWFEDPEVGCVCGQLMLLPGEKGGWIEQVYWNIENWLKRRENRLGAVLGANGGIYALRREVYEAPPPTVITDDFVIPMLIRSRGYRTVYEPAARAWEDTAPTVHHEFVRRTRIGAGNVQALLLTRDQLHPRAGWTAFVYWSHKVARWLAPTFLLLAGLASLGNLGDPFLRGVAASMAGVGLLAAGGWLLEQAGRRPPAVLAAPYAFAAINFALFRGYVDYARGNLDTRWARTPRRPGASRRSEDATRRSEEKETSGETTGEAGSG